MSNPWRHGDINELIVRASEAGDTSRVRKLEALRTAMVDLEIIKAAAARQDVSPADALSSLTPTVTEILSSIDDAENTNFQKGKFQ